MDDDLRITDWLDPRKNEAWLQSEQERIAQKYPCKIRIKRGYKALFYTDVTNNPIPKLND